MRYLIVSACLFLLSSCWFGKKHPPEPSYHNVKRWAWKPVYGFNDDYKKVTWHPTPRPVTKAGKIYVFGNRIYQNEVGAGIHVIDNSIPSQAQRVAFIEIPGNTELSIKNQSLFANNFMDIVEVDISNPSSPIEKSRIKNAFIAYDVEFPYSWQAPSDSGFYKCPELYLDSVVINWVKDSVYANCYKN